MILPHITYCNVIWGNTCKSYTANIVKLQKRALRLCCDGKVPKSDKLFSETDRLSFQNVHCMQVALLVYKYFYYPSLLPHCIALLFEKISNIHQHQTRSLDNMSLFMHPGRLNARKNSLKINAPRIWNSIPPNIRLINSSTGIFKNKYKLLLQEIL